MSWTEGPCEVLIHNPIDIFARVSDGDVSSVFSIDTQRRVKVHVMDDGVFDSLAPKFRSFRRSLLDSSSGRLKVRFQ